MRFETNALIQGENMWTGYGWRRFQGTRTEVLLWCSYMTVRNTEAVELQNSILFGLFSSILSVPLSHKTFLLTGSSTSTLPPSISTPHFSSLWVLVYWISGICFPGPVTVRRGISHWRTALIYTPLWLSLQKIRLSKKFPIHPPSPPTHTYSHI